MSAGIPDSFKIDFSKYKIDLATKAEGRMLSQFWTSPVFRMFVRALIKAGIGWTYDEIIKQIEANTLYVAAGENLEAIGRIVGQNRIPYQYDDSSWFAFDRPGQGFDQAPFWVQGAPLVSNVPANDPQYRRMILAKIASNFARFGSMAEMSYLIEFAIGIKVSFRLVGPMEADIVVPSTISRSNVYLLTVSKNTPQVDHQYFFPYPATLRIDRMTFAPKVPFIFDRKEHGFDRGSFGVSVPIQGA